MLVLGINAFHGDSAACIMRDGRLIAAAEEERFNRVKHWAGFPALAVQYCLSAAGASVGDLDIVATNQSNAANAVRRIRYALTTRPRVSAVLDRIRNRKAKSSVAEHLRSAFPSAGLRARVIGVEHHIAHMASAFYSSPFQRSAVVSIDGFGDFASAAWGGGEASHLSIDGRIYFPHSLGVFYQAITQYLGFPHYGDEYKVMGLAPYGKESFRGHLARLIRFDSMGRFGLNLEYFRHHREGFAYQWQGGAPVVGELFTPMLEQLLGPRRAPTDALEPRHFDVARSAQAVYEEAFFRLLDHVHSLHGGSSLALAGGCAMNSVANGKIPNASPFKHVYVPSSAGDAGGAVGAALQAWQTLVGGEREHLSHAYWGPEFTNDDVRGVLEKRADALRESGCHVEHVGDFAVLAERTARAIEQGAVVGFFQGRMEWGPRALGNRSILADPRRANMKEILNAKIKRRESFRPFAPAILRGEVAQWFERDADVPFMTEVFQIRAEMRSLIPAVTHVDGSGRLQTVDDLSNTTFYAVIRSFQALTGVPILLNTSFNENEPVVCQPSEAVDCFLRTQMDCLVLNNWMLDRRSSKDERPE